jgi:hypothetical protein
MLEKRNMSAEGTEKDAAGDAGALDDIVDMAAGRMRQPQGLDPRRRERQLASEVAGSPDPETAVC